VKQQQASVRVIFDQALELDSPDKRKSYLDEACAGNPALRREVEALLQAQQPLLEALRADSEQAPALSAPLQSLRPQARETAATVSPAVPAVRRSEKRWLLWLIPLIGAAAPLLLLPLLGLVGYAAFHFLANKPQVRTEPQARPEQQGSVEKREKEAADPQTLAKHAGEILRTNCHRCHGQDGVMEGGFNYVMDRQRLVDRHKIVPGQAGQSKLLRRILDSEMPPESEKQRLSPEEIAVLRRWIEVGAPEFTPAASPRQTVPFAGLPKLIRDDLAQLTGSSPTPTAACLCAMTPRYFPALSRTTRQTGSAAGS
jgi:mono/diheme cytochrome c family protein